MRISVTQRTLELLTLLQWPRVGPVKAREVLRALRSGSLLEQALLMLPSISLEQRLTAESKASAILDDCDRLEIAIVGFDDDEFPHLLRLIPDPPAILYRKGSDSALLIDGFAVVGTRKASDAGRRAAAMIAGHFATRGYSVVSGLALGIDSAAHKGALEKGGVTVAVLAHGLDTVAPSSNRPLAQRILENKGALISEHPPGVPPRPPEFVRRNRLQSGISLGSVVVESDVEGGAMHQARFTVTQHRRLFTVLATSQDSVGELNESGARHLVATMGATAVCSVADLDRELLAIDKGDAPDVPPPSQGTLPL